MATVRRLLFSRRTLALVTASTLGLAGGGYYYLNSGPAYPASTRETRRPPPVWTPPSRQAMLDALERRGAAGSVPGEEDEDVFDILIVGGGATGAGVAVDAASRGLRVALVERNDFSSGTFHLTTFFFWFSTYSFGSWVMRHRHVVQVDQARSWRRTLSTKGGDGTRLRAVQARTRGVA